MASSSAARKRKGKSTQTHNEAKFKSLYHEDHFNKYTKHREVLVEAKILVDTNELSPISEQVNKRKWQRLTKPLQAVGYTMMREFYANAWVMESERHLPLPYTSMIRGKKINFSPEEIHKVLNLRNKPLPNVASYHDRKNENDLRMNDILRNLCVPGAQWVMHDDGRPHFLRRTDLQPMARGWYEFVTHSIIPTTNRSEFMNEDLLYPYQQTELTMRNMQGRRIPITLENLKINRQREEEIRIERQRYQRILDEVAARRAKEQNKGKARRDEDEDEDDDDDDDEDENED
ncbi:hypothetical protein PIB30_095760 [Stylosanthes scabra]|uniref:Putative plant transposon protein domain-containing protein n=1 Tax=Stylosanthes scabra TaxID=79078 RepID=A0ABU6ZUP2_9FABA|nr:hypothetical protein [Stylosanthes scabra]